MTFLYLEQRVLILEQLVLKLSKLINPNDNIFVQLESRIAKVTEKTHDTWPEEMLSVFPNETSTVDSSSFYNNTNQAFSNSHPNSSNSTSAVQMTMDEEGDRNDEETIVVKSEYEEVIFHDDGHEDENEDAEGQFSSDPGYNVDDHDQEDDLDPLYNADYDERIASNWQSRSPIEESQSIDVSEFSPLRPRRKRRRIKRGQESPSPVAQGQLEEPFQSTQRDGRPIKCKQCPGLSFSLLPAFRQHQRTSHVPVSFNSAFTKRRSWVWNHFQKKEALDKSDNKYMATTCKHCQIKYDQRRSRSTANLINHMTSKHPDKIDEITLAPHSS